MTDISMASVLSERIKAAIDEVLQANQGVALGYVGVVAYSRLNDDDTDEFWAFVWDPDMPSLSRVGLAHVLSVNEERFVDDLLDVTSDED